MKVKIITELEKEFVECIMEKYKFNSKEELKGFIYAVYLPLQDKDCVERMSIEVEDE